MRDGLQIPEHLWKALERMEQEMGVPKNNLVCQAIFTLARLNGYVVAGQVSLSPVEPAPPMVLSHEKPPAASGREAAFEMPPPPPTPPPPRLRAAETPPPARERAQAPSAEPPPSHEEPPAPPFQETAPRYASMREESNTGRRSSPVAATPPPPPYEEEEAQAPILSGEHEHLATGEHGEADSAYDGAEPAPEPLTLYIEVPGEDAVPMEGDEFIIGRGKTCNFVIDSNRVSRQHARIIRDGDEFILEDLNSSNGTFFGKQREKVTRRIIVSGDEFIFGTERVTFYIQ